MTYAFRNPNELADHLERDAKRIREAVASDRHPLYKKVNEKAFGKGHAHALDATAAMIRQTFFTGSDSNVTILGSDTISHDFAALRELVKLAERLTPSGEIGDGMVAKFHELARRARGK